ncbi:hypothetical protein OESDEN_05507 [Oesophagostomum dentatum]|uniref:Uncharacterized protein n=1 Tax=Oesophagostomum dentatum TaxID=61180 RepID=A0A0B1TEM8_OESDE|nr:hypothetical protein OESDEN_05507 [Oesophagostomum dentatum]
MSLTLVIQTLHWPALQIFEPHCKHTNSTMKQTFVELLAIILVYMFTRGLNPKALSLYTSLDTTDLTITFNESYNSSKEEGYVTLVREAVSN